MHPGIIGTAFALVFLAEIPDKTALAGLVLATRYRPAYVFAGAAAGFAVQVGIAVSAGALLALLPHRAVEFTVAALFLVGAVMILRHGEAAEPAGADQAAAASETGPWRAVLTSFTVITVAEFGDLTQIVTAELTAKYDWLDVGLGSLAALWTVAGLAILGGRALLRLVPLKVITRGAALAMTALAALSLVSAIRG